MPRQARLDAPGTLHHVILRGIERGTIVADAEDRAAFLGRLGDFATATGTTRSAWVLLPNHAPRFLRSGPAGIPQVIRRLLMGYAQADNRRHRRVGHLFQNRDTSIVCEEDPYFPEMVRSIQLSPLRAKLVRDLAQLARYPGCGHAGRLGRGTPPWQDRRAELVGGGRVRSLGGWAAVQQAVRRCTARVLADERILGTGPFVERMLAAGEARAHLQHVRATRLRDAQAVIRTVCQQAGISAEELRMGGRRRRLSAVRAHLATHLVRQLGLSLADAARLLGVSTSDIAKRSRGPRVNNSTSSKTSRITSRITLRYTPGTRGGGGCWHLVAPVLSIRSRKLSRAVVRSRET